VEKSKIADTINRKQVNDCISYYVDIDFNGHFRNAEKFIASQGEEEDAWKRILAIEVSASVEGTRSSIKRFN
jgi:hypothetical protein